MSEDLLGARAESGFRPGAQAASSGHDEIDFVLVYEALDGDPEWSFAFFDYCAAGIGAARICAQRILLLLFGRLLI